MPRMQLQSFWLDWLGAQTWVLYIPKLPKKFQCAIRISNNWLKKWKSLLLDKDVQEGNIWWGGRSWTGAQLSGGGRHQPDLVKCSWISKRPVLFRGLLCSLALKDQSMKKLKWWRGGKHHSELKDLVFRKY